MVAFFHYSPIDILTVHLPPSVLEFNGQSNQDWMEKEVEEVSFGFCLYILLIGCSLSILYLLFSFALYNCSSRVKWRHFMLRSVMYFMSWSKRVQLPGTVQWIQLTCISTFWSRRTSLIEKEINTM